MKYKLYTWKLIVTGEYNNEEEAIKDLSDKYMACSKSDPPNEHPIELLTKTNNRTVDSIAKSVYLDVEIEVFGVLQFVNKYRLNIYPFKKEHWWKSNEDFKFEEREFRYEFKHN